MMKFCTYLLVFLCLTLATFAQPSRWQQRVKYLMKVEVDDVANSMKGSQVLEYWNNSPDTLKKVYYHLYWNAFQPNSMMDVRSQELGKSMISGKQDWDSRIKNRIANLKANEIGSQKILSLKMNDVDQPFKYHETILEVLLIQPILPGVKVNLTMQFETQIPIQIRRSGRDNLEGVRYSMSQWYPKICEYDYEGWHPTPYVAREFYGVWGDYDVSININKNYKLAGSGVLQNAAEIGWGYDKP
ncbi:MAG: M1 family peptidase, partial [Chitinophagaceae bacterium]